MLKNKLLQSRDIHAVSTWQLAGKTGSVEILGKLWVWAKGLQLSTVQLNKLFLVVDRDGNTAIYFAGCTSSIELLEKILGMCKETQLNPRVLCKLWSCVIETQIKTNDIRSTIILKTINCPFLLLSATWSIQTGLWLVTVHH